jgi:hypothetical protein
VLDRTQPYNITSALAIARRTATPAHNCALRAAPSRSLLIAQRA